MTNVNILKGNSNDDDDDIHMNTCVQVTKTELCSRALYSQEE